MTAKELALAKRAEKLQKEQARIAGMRAFEITAVQQQFPDQARFQTPMAAALQASQKAEASSGDSPLPTSFSPSFLLCGIDEAGRGPLAGPVAAGAVILPASSDILYINDSKKLSPKKRETLSVQIKEEAIAWNVALVDAARIDEINILQATYEAMRKAVEGLSRQPDVLVIDAVHIPALDLPQVSVIKGDAKCYSVAAASILAKVTRDHLMEELDQQYPQYGFSSNKGYGTAAHIAALRQYGPCPIHRRTFITHFV